MRFSYDLNENCLRCFCSIFWQILLKALLLIWVYFVCVCVFYWFACENVFWFLGWYGKKKQRHKYCFTCNTYLHQSFVNFAYGWYVYHHFVRHITHLEIEVKHINDCVDNTKISLRRTSKCSTMTHVVHWGVFFFKQMFL